MRQVGVQGRTNCNIAKHGSSQPVGRKTVRSSDAMGHLLCCQEIENKLNKF